jgi:hypothetical protein
MTMTECKKCGELANKSYNLTSVTIDCACGTYDEDNMIPEPVKSVIYDRSIMKYKVVNRDDFITNLRGTFFDTTKDF